MMKMEKSSPRNRQNNLNIKAGVKKIGMNEPINSKRGCPKSAESNKVNAGYESIPLSKLLATKKRGKSKNKGETLH